eukprot:TRINITY_DN11633_c0_g1_i1.p1 TRINITY_DN11633_c0_g1~~TRINITY_DN11633_c0_g1_i1.p1  ORF type:complete len:161 (-),score=24.43 TRINITY_DN11633_c0_g1_i1:461-943(-)
MRWKDKDIYLTFHIVYSMTSGSGSGNDDFIKVVAPSPPISDVDARFTAILEQLARSNEQMVKSHEAQMGMQAQIASLLQVQNQIHAQLQTSFPVASTELDTCSIANIQINISETQINLSNTQRRSVSGECYGNLSSLLPRSRWQVSINDHIVRMPLKIKK